MIYEIIFLISIFAISIGFFIRKKYSVISLAPQKTFGDDLKMVMVVRSDLKMGNGKIAAQCCHACLGLYKAQIKKDIPRLQAWEEKGNYKKIVLKCPTEEDMLNIAEKARQNSLEYYIVRDAGLTQITPGSKTVLSIGPATEEELKPITGHLKLL